MHWQHKSSFPVNTADLQGPPLINRGARHCWFGVRGQQAVPGHRCPGERSSLCTTLLRNDVFPCLPCSLATANEVTCPDRKCTPPRRTRTKIFVPVACYDQAEMNGWVRSFSLKLCLWNIDTLGSFVSAGCFSADMTIVSKEEWSFSSDKLFLS